MVLRRRLRNSVVASTRDDDNQLRLAFAEVEEDTQLWEHAVLVTSLDLTQVGGRPGDDVLALAKVIGGQRICRSTGSADISEAERYLARLMEQTRQAQVYGVGPSRTFDEAAAKVVLESSTSVASRMTSCI